MADFYVDSNGKVTKRKKKNSVAYVVNSNGTVTRVDDDDDDIAPIRQDIVKREEDDSKLDFFQKSKAFDDGWQFGDLTRTILGTAGDALLEVGKGVGGLVEGVTDAVSYGVAGITDVLGADEFAERTRKRAMENRIEQWTENLDNRFEQNSVLGRTSDAILQGVGQVGGIMATGGIAGAAGLGSAGATMATTGLMGISGFGSGAGEAYKAGATDGEAMTYGLISGAADAFTEMIFGGLGKAVGAVGLSKGLSSADDLLAKKVSNLFTNQITKNFAEYGIKAGAEGVEEVLAGVLQAAGKKITYMQDEELLDLVKDENLLEQFVVGAATSGMIQSGMIPGTSKGSLKESNKEGRDFITGYNQSEQSVIDKEVEKRVAAQEEKSGTKLTKKEIGAIEKAVQEDLDKGFISIDTIEEVLGGETYSIHKKLVDAEEKMQAEYDELGKKPNYTMEDAERRKELKDRLQYVREKGARGELRKRLDDEVATLTKDSRLVESFNERARRGQKFEADVSQYSEKQRAIVQKAVESGILNNTRRTHEFVDMVARIAADKGVAFDFTNNAKLKESGFAVEGKTVNGFVTKDGITVNIQSAKSLNSVVGHEITHVLEGTELYAEMQKAVFQYAETKGDVADRRAVLEKLYKGVEGANIDAELTADLVGDYLFTDSDFINNLSANHRNVFQKIYDEVKYLLKVATAGSKEARELEKVKRAFEKAYREGGNNKTAEDGGMKYSLYVSPEEIPDYLKAGNRRNKNRQKRYDEGQQIAVSTEAEFDAFVREAVDGKPGAMVAYGKVEESLAAQVKQMSDEKIDIDDAYLELLADDVQHAYTEHASAKEPGDMDMSVDDLIYALKKVNEGEVVSAVQYKDGSQRVKLAIPAKDGMMMLVEIASKSAGTLRLKTGWKVTPEKFAQKYKSSTSTAGSEGSTNTARENAASNGNVAQTEENVKAQFSLSEEIEPTDRLVAVHNKSVRGLQRMLDRGGVPFASIAIKKAGAPHEGFGEVSIVFPRSTIDPEGNRWNKLYSNDAWTPTEPHTEYDVGDTYKYKKLFENMLGSDIYNALRGSSYLDSDALERELGSSGGDVFEAVKRLGVVKYGYLQSIGQRPEMTTKPKSLDGFGRYKNEQLLAVFEALDGETIRNASYDSVDVKQQIADVLNRQFEQQLPQDDEVLEKFRSNPLYTADKIRIAPIQDAYETWEAAGRTIPMEPDTYALENALRDNRELEESADFRRWVEDTFDGLVKDSGIPNGRDYYTPSGNRRSFKQLHVPATLENIVQQMRKENETGIGAIGSINLRGAATKTYATVEEMRADSGKLLGTHVLDEVYDGYMDGFHARLNELTQKSAKGDDWSSRDTAEQILLEAVRDAKTKASMASKLRKEAQWINFDPALVDELWQLKQDVQNMPAPYFEAKPRRIVTTDEAAAYIVPDDAPASLFAKLGEMGLAYKTYKAGDEADRLAKLNSVLDEQPDLRFSLSAEGDIAPTFGNYNVRGEDIALEGADIAPVRQDVAPVAVANNATTADAPVAEQEETAVSPYDELDQLEAQLEEMEQRQEELLAAGEYEQAEALLVEMGPASARMTELQNQIEEVEAQQAAEERERLASFNDEDAPVPGEPTHSEDTDTVTLPTKRRNDIAAKARKALGFAQNRVNEMRELVDKFSQGEIDSEMLHDEIAERFGTYTETSRNEEVAEVRNWLRTSRIRVSDDVKSNFADYGKSVFRPNRGRLLFSNEGLDVDLYYAELADKFPGFFPSDIANPADQLEQIIKVANMDITTEQSYEMDDEMLQGVVDEIVMSVNEYRRSQRQAAAEASIATANASLAQDSNVPADEDIAPVRADVEQKPIGGQTIKTMQERLDAKVQNLQTELDNTKRQREGAVSYYQRKVAEKQAEYDRRKNKNTKAAYDNLRSIERYRRIGSNIDADFAKKVSDLEGRVAKASEDARNGENKEVQGAMRKELQAAKIGEINAALAAKGYDMPTVLANAKNLSTWSTVDNTPERVNEKTFGYKVGQIINSLTIDRLRQHTTEGTRWLNGITDRKSGLLAQLSKEYKIKPGSKESEAAQMYAEGYFVDGNGDKVEYGDRELAMDFPDANVQANIKGLARDPRIRQFYDETLARINESRTRNAYAAIKPLQNYFLHFRAMDDFFSKMGIPFNPNDIKAKDLPTDMNGVTADLKPGQPYFASSKHRKGIDTTFDLLGGLERYARSAMPQIYYIDDIQMLRAFRNYIADSFGQAHGLEGLDTMTEEEVAAQIEKVYGSHLSNYARFLTEEANVVAGKTAMTDRAVEGIIGRRGLTALDTLNRQVGANMVGFNVSSSLTNFIAAVQAFSKTNKAAFMKGFAQTVANRIGAIRGKTDGFAENNPTMIRRKGADNFNRTPWQKIGDVGYLMMSAVDSLSTEMIVRGKYNELIAKGVSEEQAVEWADKWASRLMGDRSIGQQPQLYNSKTLGIFTKFQLEVRNQLDSMFYDTIQEAKLSNEDIQNAQARNAKTAAQVASTLATLAVTSHLFGKAFEAVAGYNPAFDIIEAIVKAFGWDDEEESEDTVLDNLGQGFMSLLEDMPYSSLITDGGRIPISSALPLGQLIKGEDKYGNEKSRLETVKEAAGYYLLPGGYGQIKKTKAGLEMFNIDEDHPIAGSYTDSGNLRFTVDDTFENRAQAAVFGQWASGNAREYFDKEYKPLQEKQIQELVDSGLPMKEYRDYRDGLKGLDTLGEKVAYIADLDLPMSTKNLLVNNIADRKEPIDLTDFDEYSDWGEFEYAHKYPKKYDFLTANNISVAQYEAFDEDTKKAWTWAYQNPEKFALSRAVSDDLMVYRQYSDELSEIKADKYADGRTVNGSRKTKVLNYLNNLDADYYTKLLLFKMEYNADDTYNREIIEYLNNRADISFEEEVTILKELGFTVTADGTVRW